MSHNSIIPFVHDGIPFMHDFFVGKESWYDDSADAESKPAYAVLPSLRDALYRNPWLEK